MPVKQILYVSKSLIENSESEVEKIVASARRSNRERNVTGSLLFSSGLFMQLIEGESATIDSLYSKIKIDARHIHVTELLSISVNERAFPDWSMGMKDISELQMSTVNEMLSWTNLINKARTIDNNLILQIIHRFVAISKAAA